VTVTPEGFVLAEAKQFQICFKTVLFQFHVLVYGQFYSAIFTLVNVGLHLLFARNGSKHRSNKR